MKYPDSPDFLKKVGMQLRKKRKELKLTMLDVAIKSGLEESAIQRIETGRVNSTLKTLLKIVNAMDIEFGDIFEFTEEEL